MPEKPEKYLYNLSEDMLSLTTLNYYTHYLARSNWAYILKYSKLTQALW